MHQKIEAVKARSNLMARGVRSVLNIKHSEKFLETIYIPFFSHFMVWDSSVSKRKLGDSCPRNLEELHELAEGLECRGELRKFAFKIENIRCDVGLIAKPNIYEKVIYSIFRLSYSEIVQYEDNPAAELETDVNARLSLKDYLQYHESNFHELVDLIPLTLFEGLKKAALREIRLFPKVHTLGPYYNESYLFSLAALKERDTKIIGQPHGGGFCQFEFPTKYEVCEKALTDIYLEPSWDPAARPFPNLRVSRNLFLSLKNIFGMKKKNRMLVLLGYFYMDEDPRAINNVTGDYYQNVFYERQLKALGDHFRSSFDFKLYVRQLNDESLLHTLDYLRQLYPGSELIRENRSVLELSRNYDGVIHLDTWGTAVMELSASSIPQYVYIGPELRLRKDYEHFLWDTRKSSTKQNYSQGTYVLVDNKKFRSAYGASFFYPLYYVALIKTLIKKWKWVSLSLWSNFNFKRNL